MQSAAQDADRRIPGGTGTEETTPVRSTEELIAEFDEERPARRLSGPLARAVGAVALGVSVYALYAVFVPVQVLPYRMGFLAAVLPLTFLCYRARVRPRRHRPRRTAETEAAATEAPPAKGRDNPGVLDWILAGLSLVVCAYPLVGFDDFIRRVYEPSVLDVAMGLGCLVLVLEATRRTVGAILPAICLGFLAYAYYGGYLPVDWSLGHRGYDIDRIVAHLYMGTEGLFGVPLDVAATYIVLFAIYGAVLEYSGAGEFFVNIAFAAFRRSSAAAG
ncbi:MAG: TRAP transporter large permease subunit, partial [Actinomycetes bacterium]